MNKYTVAESEIDAFLCQFKRDNQSDIKITDPNQFQFNKEKLELIVLNPSSKTILKLAEAIKSLLSCLHTSSEKRNWCDRCIEAFGILKFDIEILDFLDFTKDHFPTNKDQNPKEAHRPECQPKNSDHREKESTSNNYKYQENDKYKNTNLKRQNTTDYKYYNVKESKYIRRSLSKTTRYSSNQSQDNTSKRYQNNKQQYDNKYSLNHPTPLVYKSTRRLHNRLHSFSRKDYKGSYLVVNGQEVTTKNAFCYFNILLFDFEWMCNLYYSGPRDKLQSFDFNYRTSETEKGIYHPIFDEQLRNFYLREKMSPVEYVKSKVKNQIFKMAYE